ncbi:Alpha/Beta hydrolase protein [Mycena crocata]|nr:Alpha/Beta hydrolase protein [Mycena crocata]
MRFPFSLLGLSLQNVLQSDRQSSLPSTRTDNFGFALKEAADVFSPKNLVELGRPGIGVANELDKFQQVYLCRVVEVVHRSPRDTRGEAFWLDRRTIGHAVEEDEKLDLYALAVDFETGGLSANESPILIGSFPTKTATKFKYSHSDGVLIFSDLVYADGNLSSTREQDRTWGKRGTTAMVFDKANVRFWDTWSGPKVSSLFSVQLTRGPNQQWKMGTIFDNLLKGTGHTSDDFFVAGKHVLYTSSDPELPQSLHGRRDVFLVDTADPGNPTQLTTGKQGATQSPILNSNVTKAAWIQLDDDVGGSGRGKIVLFDLISETRFTLAHKWDRSPESLAFSVDGDVLYITAEDHAKTKIFALPVPPTQAASAVHPILTRNFHTPVVLTHKGAAVGIQPLPTGGLLFTMSSYTSPNDVYLIRDVGNFGKEIKTMNQARLEFKGEIHQITHLTADELSEKDLHAGEEFWFKGALGKDVHGWLFKPKGWKKEDKKKWPIVMVIHGGPQSSFQQLWSTRWNPNIFSQQGYFSIWMNPTGSTGFGESFAAAITEDWGGKPFIDMIAGYNFILKSYPQIDPERAVAAGASWGGYAVNWIQGHPEYGFGFKALVCHDGVFDSSYSSYASDVPRMFNNDFGGVAWSKKGKSIHNHFSPANYVNKWSTPQLLIHGSLDYRLPEVESIGPFHALQQLGIPSRLVIFPDENHWVLGHENSVKWHYEVFKWFDEFVGDHLSVIG